MSLTVKEVIKNSPAAKAGVISNDIIHKINKIEMNDFIDDTYVSSLRKLKIDISRDGKQKSIKIKKKIDEDIGLIYKEELYPKEVECINGCIFCFVDQLPNGMRKSLYVRDDDWRYSVLYGNYITMTNMSDEDFSRVFTRKVSPLYISVHSTNPDVRFELLRNKKARLINEQLQQLYNNKITFHSQIVLCPGINDGDDLKHTIKDLMGLYPYSKTLSIVPVGLTQHRDNLPELTHVNKVIANEVIDIVNEFRAECINKLGEPFVYASDEFYSKAEKDYPRYAPGEINAQKANGAGLFSDFLDEFESALVDFEPINSDQRKVILVTGASAFKEISKCAKKIEEKAGNISIEVIKVINKKFGETITVAGLLTGYDIIDKVGNKNADVVFIPESSLRSDENIFLDDMTLDNLENEIGCKVAISPNDGYDFVKALIGGNFE